MIMNANNGVMLPQGIGCVDLGSLNWTYFAQSSSYPYGFYYTHISDKTFGYSNILSCEYPLGTNFYTDKRAMGNDQNSIVYIIDSDYTDAATFKTAVNGKLLFYVKA